MKVSHFAMSVAFLCFEGSAFAQVSTDLAEKAPEQVDSANSDYVDIVVTAQKRSERQVDVPASVTTVSAAALELSGPSSLTSLTKLVPGIYINQATYNLSPTVRGIGSTLSTTQESNVAVYVDGVYQPMQSSNLFDLSSVSDVEVLKGPQGTLFGRNATGGAILVKTLDPNFTPSGNFKVSYSRFDEVRSSAYLNVPISDVIAVNGAILYRYSRGYIRDARTNRIANEGRDLLARGKILVRPTSWLDLILTASHSESSDPTGTQYQAYKGGNVYSTTPGAGPIAADRYHVSHNVQDVLKPNSDEYNLRATIDAGVGTLTSISAFKRDVLTTSNDIDNSYLPSFQVDFQFKTKTLTQEVNFTSKTGSKFEYVVGAYYFKNKADYGYYRSNSVNYLFIDRHVTSISGYADGTLHLGDLALIAGLRYSRERRRQTNGLFVPTLNSRYIAAEDSSWTPRVGVRYALGPRTNIYATYTKGFKSGAFDTASLTNVGVTPEKVNAYEVGFKTTGPVFTFNSAAYYYDYRDIQANTQLITNGIAVSSLRNAGKARIYGLELDGTARISEPFNIRMALAYTNAKYTEFPGAPGYLPLANGGNQSIFIDASGNRMVRAPKYTASLQLNYEAEIAGRELSLSLSPSYTSGLYFDIANTQRQGGVFLLDASAALDLSDQLKVSVFGRNLTDRIYQTYNFQSTFGTQVLFAKPRTYGVSLAYSF